MPDFDSIDLLNFATYGNEEDPEWEKIRNYVRNNPQAQKTIDLLKENIQKDMKKNRGTAVAEPTVREMVLEPAPIKTKTRFFWRRSKGE